MKKYIYTILAIGTVFLFTACADELKNQFTAKNVGEEIIFGGRATYELNESNGKKNAPATRTVYTGTFLNAKGETWKEGDGTKYEGIHWVSGDKVRIFCEDAKGTTVADYNVNVSNKDNATGSAELSKIGNVGLQWGDATEYDFYAVYPSPHQYPLKDDGAIDANVDGSVLNNSTTITGTIPVVQTPLKRESDGNGNYTFAPRMEYAYMVAHQHIKDANKTNAEIYLNFAPIATAVEIELYNGITGYEANLSTLELTNILISAKTSGTKICGDFVADLKKLTEAETGSGIFTGIPANFVTDGASTYEQITIPMFSDGLYGTPTPLAPGKSVKFTLFMLPNQDVNDLNITIQGAKGTATGTTSNINIKVNKKTYLKQMPITNAVMPFDQSRWVTYLPDNAYLKGLSIPGAGGAASGYIYADNAGETGNNAYLEQSLEIDELWTQGIRCFEFTVDKVASGISLGSSNVICNKQNTGKTLDYCITEVTKLLAKNPKEFAMVIITYQDANGWNQRDESTGAITETRDPATFMSQLNAYWKDLTLPTSIDPDIELKKALYTTDLTIATARGKLFCIARPTSNGEDNYAKIELTTDQSWVGRNVTKINSTTYENPLAIPTVSESTILVIHGWGALKDKWYARGFTECIYHRGNGWSTFREALTVDQCRNAMGWNVDRPGRPFDTSSNKDDVFTTLGGNDYYAGNGGKNYYPASRTKTSDITELKNNVNFYYTTVSSNELKAQGAWVQEWARVSPETKTYTITSTSNYVKWLESISEKKNHISDCLNRALNKEEEDNTIYINSLCGYYITDNVEKSIYPNSLTDFNIKMDNYETGNFWNLQTVYVAQPNKLSTMSSDAGMCGDIATFAKDINDYFYDLLKSTTEATTYEPGPMGIILMDRVSAKKEDNGSKIPSIIIANNFQHVLPSAPVTKLAIPRDPDGYNEENGDKFAAPAKRNAKGDGIVWE